MGLGLWRAKEEGNKGKFVKVGEQDLGSTEHIGTMDVSYVSGLRHDENYSGGRAEDAEETTHLKAAKYTANK